MLLLLLTLVVRIVIVIPIRIVIIYCNFIASIKMMGIMMMFMNIDSLMNCMWIVGVTRESQVIVWMRWMTHRISVLVISHLMMNVLLPKGILFNTMSVKFLKIIGISAEPFRMQRSKFLGGMIATNKGVVCIITRLRELRPRYGIYLTITSILKSNTHVSRIVRI